MKAIDFLKSIPQLPIYPRSNSKIWNLLDQSAVQIDNKRPKPNDEIYFPLTEVVFYPSGRRCTLWQTNYLEKFWIEHWKDIRRCGHFFNWVPTKLRGFAQCTKCFCVIWELEEKDCGGYIDPEIILAERKIKRKIEREKIRLATIKYLNETRL